VIDDDAAGAAQDPPAATAASAVRAVREIVTASVVHRDTPRADDLVSEYLATYGCALVDAASTFIAHHLTDAATPELAEDRFLYLLTRIGNLIDLAAEVTDADPGVVVRDVVDGIGEMERSIGDPRERDVYRAAQTCLIAHRFVRLGRPAWGIQKSLDQNDMLVLNSVLAKILVLLARAFPEDARARVFMVLLGEASHVLSCQASAQDVTVERLVEGYFTALSAQEACRRST